MCERLSRLSGPSGAGKSAWVRHLAALMGLPALQKRASDLLDPYVGGTEQNIAGAFAEARMAFRRFFGLKAPAGLDGLRCLTPADFALVARRAALGGATSDPAALVRLLAAESAGRAGGRGPLGFAGSAAA